MAKRKPRPKKLKLVVPPDFKAHHNTEIVSVRESLTKVCGGADNHFVKTTWPEHLRSLGGKAARHTRTSADTDDWGK